MHLPLTCTRDMLPSKRTKQRNCLIHSFQNLTGAVWFSYNHSVLVWCCLLLASLFSVGESAASSPIVCDLATSHWLNSVARLLFIQSQYLMIIATWMRQVQKVGSDRLGVGSTRIKLDCKIVLLTRRCNSHKYTSNLFVVDNSNSFEEKILKSFFAGSVNRPN